jgi:hypothetical protein
VAPVRCVFAMCVVVLCVYIVRQLPQLHLEGCRFLFVEGCVYCAPNSGRCCWWFECREFGLTC